MKGTIYIEIESDLEENEFTQLDEELRELMVEMNLICTIRDEVTESIIIIE